MKLRRSLCYAGDFITPLRQPCYGLLRRRRRRFWVNFFQTSSAFGDLLDLSDHPLLLDIFSLGPPQLRTGLGFLFSFKVSFEKHPSVQGVIWSYYIRLTYITNTIALGVTEWRYPLCPIYCMAVNGVFVLYISSDIFGPAAHKVGPWPREYFPTKEKAGTLCPKVIHHPDLHLHDILIIL